MKILIGLLPVLLLVSCSSTPEAKGSQAVVVVDRRHSVYESMSVAVAGVLIDDQQAGGEFDWQANGPLELLDYLRSIVVIPPSVSQFNSFIVRGTHRGWIAESDIEPLFRLIDSEAPCIGVSKAISSFLAFGNSTVGKEAAHLILSYRSEVNAEGYGGYPILLSSVSFQIDKQELRQWWDGRKN